MRIILPLILLLSSCTTIEYSSNQSIPTYISAKENHNIRRRAEGTKEFYLWGMVPEKHVVKIDYEMRDAGLISAANTRVEEYQTFKQKVYTILSLGMYVPKSYRLTSFGIKQNYE